MCASIFSIFRDTFTSATRYHLPIIIIIYLLTLPSTLNNNIMAKATTIKEAIKKWEEKTGLQAATATEVSLIFQWPPIEKMDNTLSCLANCEKLSLSTNMIEKVTALNSLKKLRILSLGRNYIKSFSGMECLADTLEELWISYNLIEKMKGVGALRNLRVLYMSNNLVKEWSEFNKLQELQYLEDLLFVGNPLYDGCELEAWRAEVARRLPALKKLDGETVLRDEPPLTVADMQVEADCGDAVETLVSAETNEV